MLKVPVIALDITHLTDARYFAALDVDYLVFDQESSAQLSVEAIKEIIEWVEGPKHLGKQWQWDQSSFAKLEERLLDGMVVTQFQDFSATDKKRILSIDADLNMQKQISRHLDHCDGFILYPKYISELEFLSEWKESTEWELFIDISPFTIDEINKIIDRFGCGIAVKGEAEEKVGFKSFDFLDDLFESLTVYD